MNSEMPRTPDGAPLIRASTMCTMLAEIVWSPPEMNIFCPNTRYVPSACGSARVRMSPSAEPWPGSVSAIVPAHRPSPIAGR